MFSDLNQDSLIKRSLLQVREVCAFYSATGDSALMELLDSLRPHVKTCPWVAAYLIDSLIPELDEFCFKRCQILNLLREELPDHEGLKFLVRWGGFQYRGEDGVYSCLALEHMEKYWPRDPWFRNWIQTLASIPATLEGDHRVMWKDLACDASRLLLKWAGEEVSLFPVYLFLSHPSPLAWYKDAVSRFPSFPWEQFHVQLTFKGRIFPMEDCAIDHQLEWNPGVDPTGYYLCSTAAADDLPVLFRLGADQTCGACKRVREKIALFARTIPEAWEWMKEHADFAEDQAWWDAIMCGVSPEPGYLKQRIEDQLASPTPTPAQNNAEPLIYLAMRALHFLPGALSAEEDARLLRRVIASGVTGKHRIQLITLLLRCHSGFAEEYDELFELIKEVSGSLWDTSNSLELLLASPSHRTAVIDFLVSPRFQSECARVTDLLKKSAPEAGITNLVFIALNAPETLLKDYAFRLLREKFPEASELRKLAEILIFEQKLEAPAARGYLMLASVEESELWARLNDFLSVHAPKYLTWLDFHGPVEFPSLPPSRAHQMIRCSCEYHDKEGLEFMTIALWCKDEAAAMDFLFEEATRLGREPSKSRYPDENAIQLLLQQRWPYHERVRRYCCANLNRSNQAIRDSAARFLCTAHRDHPDTKTLLRPHIKSDVVLLGLYIAIHQQWADVADEIFEMLQGIATQGGLQSIAKDTPVLLVRRFGPRKDLLEQLAGLADISTHREFERTIVSLLESYAPHSPRIGLQGKLKEGRLSALEKLNPHSYQPEHVLKLAQQDAVPEVRLKALEVMWALGDRQEFPHEALRSLCLSLAPAFALLKETSGDEAAVKALLDFGRFSRFTDHCAELTSLICKEYSHTLLGQQYLAKRLGEKLDDMELNLAAEVLAPQIQQYPELKRMLCGLVLSSRLTTTNCCKYLAQEIEGFSASEKLQLLVSQAFRDSSEPGQNVDSAIVILIGETLVSDSEEYAQPSGLAQSVISALVKIMRDHAKPHVRNLANFTLGQILFGEEPSATKIRQNFPDGVKAMKDFMGL